MNFSSVDSEDAPAPKVVDEAASKILVEQERCRTFGVAILLVENLSKKKALDALYRELEKVETILKEKGAEVPSL